MRSNSTQRSTSGVSSSARLGSTTTSLGRNDLEPRPIEYRMVRPLTISTVVSDQRRMRALLPVTGHTTSHEPCTSGSVRQSTKPAHDLYYQLRERAVNEVHA